MIIQDDARLPSNTNNFLGLYSDFAQFCISAYSASQISHVGQVETGHTIADSNTSRVNAVVPVVLPGAQGTGKLGILASMAPEVFKPRVILFFSCLLRRWFTVSCKSPSKYIRGLSEDEFHSK